MSYTRLVVYSILPCALMTYGLSDSPVGDVERLIVFAGAVLQAFVLARFFDKRREET